MNIENEIVKATLKVVKELYGQDVDRTAVQLQKTRADFEGNLTLVVFPFLKISKKKPEDTAKELRVIAKLHQDFGTFLLPYTIRQKKKPDVRCL